MSDDDLLFDYMYLENEDREEENERLREENDDLKDQLDKRRASIYPGENDEDKPRFFAEDFQTVAGDCGMDMEISYEEAEVAISLGFTPETYYEYKMKLKNYPPSKGKGDDLRFD